LQTEGQPSLPQFFLTEESKLSEFISLKDAALQFGVNEITHLSRDVKRRFPELLSKRRIDNQGHLVWVIPVAKKEELFLSLGYSSKDGIIKDVDPQVYETNFSASARAKRVFEQDGWTAHFLTPNPVGTPDLIMHKAGIIRYREVKASSDGLRKEQWEELFRLRGLGFDAWVCDDEGVDWPQI
jgi:hypothetical protein